MNILIQLRNKIGNYILSGLVLLSTITLLSCLWGLFSDSILPPAVIARPAPTITTITVPEPIFSERVINTFTKVEDRTAIKKLEDENKKLKVEVSSLLIALAQYKSQGSGTIIVGDLSTLPPQGLPEFSFTDWRLVFRGKGTTASYTLSQQFKVYNTIGKNRDGVPTNIIHLYEIGPQKEQLPIQTVETLTLVEPSPSEGWYTKPTVQAGWASIAPTTTTSITPTASGIVAIPWLKHGKTRTTEDTRWAFFTPTFAVSKTERTIGVMPVSFNLGTLPHQPFSNVWVSPFIGSTNGAQVNRGGFVLSVTF